MTCSAPANFVYGTIITNPQNLLELASPRRVRPAPSYRIATNPLERLAQLMLSNERLMEDLATSRSRIASARGYLDGPDCHVRFGEAHLDRSRAKHSGILAQLRANRIEALHLLAEAGSDD